MLCHACRCNVAPRPPRARWKVLCVAFWVGCLAVTAAFGLVIALNIVLLPIAIAISSVIGYVARRLNDWSCPRCGAEMVEPADTADLLPLRRWRRAQHLGPAAAGA